MLVRAPRPRHREPPAPGPRAARVRRDGPFLALIGATGLAALAGDFFLSGTSVYLLGELRARPWLPGTALALSTGISAVGGTAAVRVTRRLRRSTAMALGAALYAAWCGAMAAARAAWLPWLLVGAAATLAVLVLRGLAGHLPAAALFPEVARPRRGPA